MAYSIKLDKLRIVGAKPEHQQDVKIERLNDPLLFFTLMISYTLVNFRVGIFETLDH